MPKNVKPKPPIVFPGEKGFSVLAANETFNAIGKATKCHYRFVVERGQYVDKRDLPGLPREKFS